MTKLDFNRNFESIVERTFDLNETVAQLKHDYIRYICWGVSSLSNYNNQGLLLNVNARHVKGFVFITLAWDDTYTVRFLNAQYNECKPMLTNVYCDELTKRIDEVIEYIPEYKY